MVTLVFEHSDIAGVDRLGEILRDHGHELRIIRPDQGDPIPPDLLGVDAVVSCGGGASPDEELDWIDNEIAFLRSAHEAGLPTLGICLGSQLLGRALGGSVAPMSEKEIGWFDVTLTPAGCDDPLFAGIGWTTMQAHWHGYEVTELPPDARLLASSEKCRNQAWAVGISTYGIQYHPEIHARRLGQWADDEPTDLEKIGLTREALDLGTT